MQVTHLLLQARYLKVHSNKLFFLKMHCKVEILREFSTKQSGKITLYQLEPPGSRFKC